MFEFVWWLIVGAAAGGLASFLFPGKLTVGRWSTIAAGLIGSTLGGLLSAAIYAFSPLSASCHPMGLLMSAVGALVALECFVSFARRSAYARRPIL